MISLYIHIPFCLRKCNYCDFLSFPCEEDIKEQYIEALVREIRASEYVGKSVRTVYVGGGTPSTLSTEHLKAIMDTIYECFDMTEVSEVSIECNPGTVDADKLKSIKALGFNRLSMGLQSAQDEELKLLGRIHSYEDFLDSYNAAIEAGFTNINIDIMSALPGQSIDTYRDTLQKVAALKPQHISAYSLIVEEGTPFYEEYGEGCPKEYSLPSEEDERAMYYLTSEILSQHGYHRYEISNYAKEGYECEHNKVYWTLEEYLGFGIGAASMMDNCRFSNIEDIYKYIEVTHKEGNLTESIGEDDGDLDEEYINPYCELRTAIAPQSLSDRQEDFCIVGLRLLEGISRSRFKELFGTSIDDVYGDVIEKLCREELLKQNGDYLRLTPRGIDVSNRVLAFFLKNT